MAGIVSLGVKARRPKSRTPVPTSGAAEDLARLAGCGRTQASLRAIAFRILGDSHEADDVLQSAFAQAWAAPPRVLSLSWLRRVVASRAIDVKRQPGAQAGSLRQAMDQVAPGGSASGPLEALEAHRRLSGAIRSLPKEQAEALYLRYFEDMRPKAMARSLGVPIETVKSRLVRGLRALRIRLEEDSGDDGLSMQGLALLALAPGSRTPGIAAALAGGSATNVSKALIWSLLMKKWILGIAAILAVFAAIPRGERAPRDEGISLGEQSSIEASRQDLPALEPPPLDQARVSLDAAPLAVTPPTLEAVDKSVAHASIQVSVLWEDGSSATGTQVACLREDALGRPVFVEEATVGSKGLAVFHECRAGEYLLVSSIRGKAEVAVQVGDAVTALIEIPDGIDIVGSVKNFEGRPVPGAELWVLSGTAGWEKHHRVGKADAAGQFRLRDQPLFASLGAMARGYEPSTWSPVSLLKVNGTRESKDRTADLELVLREGGAALTGTVLDAEGEPVEGAVVAVSTQALGDRLASPSLNRVTRFARSGSMGEYELAGLPSGKAQVSCRAPGLASYGAALQLKAGAPQRYDIQLVVPGRVVGWVRSASGAPLAGVAVSAYSEPLAVGLATRHELVPGSPEPPRALSDTDGRFVIEGVSPGESFLYAVAQAYTLPSVWQTLFDRTEVTISPTNDARWDPVIAANRKVAGTLLYADLTPAIGQTVRVHSDATDEVRFAKTNDVGNFVLHNLDEEAYTVVGSLPVEGKDNEVITVEGVRPDGGQVRLVALEALSPGGPAAPGTSTIRGRVVDPFGRMERHTYGYLETEHGEEVESMRFDLEAAQQGIHSYQFSSVSAGRYRVRLQTANLHTLAVTEVFEVAEGESADFGDLELPMSGGQRIVFKRDPDWPATDGFLFVDAVDGSYDIRDFISQGDEVRLFENLNPGRYTVRCHGGHLVPTGTDFYVTAGEVGETVVELTVGANVSVTVLATENLLSPGLSSLGAEEPVQGVTVRALSETGEELVSMTLSADSFTQGRSSAGFCLPKGTVTFEAEHPLVGMDSKTVTLKRVGGEAPGVTLDLDR